MKNLTIFFTVTCVVLASCSKNGELPYIPQNMLRNGNFEDVSLLDELWLPEGEGYSISNTTDYYEGERSLELGALSCRGMEYEEVLYAESGKTYELSFAIKMPGLATGCAGEFVVSIRQGDEEILYFNISPETAPEWNIQKYYITPQSDLPLNLEFIVGMDKLMLDDMQLKEVVEL
jgi:hypothetical protein